MLEQSPGHKALKKTLKKILENADFELVDTEVNIDTDDDGETEFSIDVCALHKKTLFVFQCKDINTMSSPKKEFGATQRYINEVLAKKFKVISSDNGYISDSVLNKITGIKCCYAFTKKLTNKNMEKNVTTAKFIFWDDKTVRYYKRVSEILKHITKHEILKEFGINSSPRQTFEEDAVKIDQEGNSFYLLGMHPGLLLKIAYVYRRTSNKPQAYQRMISKDRIDSISKFFNSKKEILLPNPVIIVFDKDKSVQDKIKFKSNKLTFPTSYCSAWIIDGQHRIFGFKEHMNYKEWDSDDDDFKIPVVAFTKLSFIKQNKAFVNINYHQKKIDAVLFNDLSTIIRDLTHEITWPSLLVSELNKNPPWKDMIKVSELDTKKPITISGFAKTKLLYTLLGYNKRTNSYSGHLFNVAKFDPTKSWSNKTNQSAFNKQLKILIRFFIIVRKKVKHRDPKKDMWINSKDYGLTKFTSINALLLVLNALLEKDPTLKMNLDKLLNALRVINFENDSLLAYGRGYPAMPKIANKIIKEMNSKYGAKLNTV